MNEVEAILSLIEKVSQLSGVGMAIGVLFLFYKGIVVWGWQKSECEKRRDAYEATILNHTAKTEAKLAELESRYNGNTA